MNNKPKSLVARLKNRIREHKEGGGLALFVALIGTIVKIIELVVSL